VIVQGPRGREKMKGEQDGNSVQKLDLIVQELEMGGGCENLYSSDGHQDTGGAAPP
jgi:hypothetical protein